MSCECLYLKFWDVCVLFLNTHTFVVVVFGKLNFEVLIVYVVIIIWFWNSDFCNFEILNFEVLNCCFVCHFHIFKCWNYEMLIVEYIHVFFIFGWPICWTILYLGGDPSFLLFQARTSHEILAQAVPASLIRTCAGVCESGPKPAAQKGGFQDEGEAHLWRRPFCFRFTFCGGSGYVAPFFLMLEKTKSVYIAPLTPDQPPL